MVKARHQVTPVPEATSPVSNFQTHVVSDRNSSIEEMQGPEVSFADEASRTVYEGKKGYKGQG